MTSQQDGANIVAPSPKKKQMLLNDDLKLFLADILHADLQDPESKFSMAMEPTRTRGRPDAIKNLLDFLLKSEHKSCKDRSTTPATLTKWIDDLTVHGAKENQRRIDDAGYGRNSRSDPVMPWEDAWSASGDLTLLNIQINIHEWLELNI